MTDVLQAIGGLKATTFSDTVLCPMYAGVITEAVFWHHVSNSQLRLGSFTTEHILWHV